VFDNHERLWGRKGRRRNIYATVDIGTGRSTACPETTGFECVSAASQLTQGKLLVAHLDKVHESLHSAVNVLPPILDPFLGLPEYANKMPGQVMGASIHPSYSTVH
jgi:hypothetical protein